MNEAGRKVKAGDNVGPSSCIVRCSIKCLFPKKAKDAAKELNKRGVTEIAMRGSLPASPRA